MPRDIFRSIYAKKYNSVYAAEVELFSKYLKGDKAIWGVVLFLSIASILLVYSSIVTLAYRHHDGNTFYYLFRHGGFVVVGLGLTYLIHRIDYRLFSRLSQVLLFVSIPLLLLTLVLGVNINDASRWLRIPVINQTFQTSDLAKLALIMFTARYIAIKGDDLKDLRNGFLPILLPIGLVCGLILPANLSTASVLFLSCLVLLFLGGARLKHIGGLIGSGFIALAFVFLIGKAVPGTFNRLDTWVNRIETFAGAKEAKPGNSYQSDQAKIALASGGIAGKGPGNSTQRNFLPHPYSDFIFAIVGEEYGFMGCMFVIMLYLILLYRAVLLVKKATKPFGAFIVLGIMFSLVFQAMINMAVAVNLVPVTGQPLPLISMGGTSIWFTCMALGIVLSVSRSVENDDEPVVMSQSGNAYVGVDA